MDALSAKLLDRGEGPTRGWCEPLDVLAPGKNVDSWGPFLMPGLEEVTQLPPAPQSSDHPFREYAKLGMFSEAGFKTDISVEKKKITNVFAKDPESL